MYTYLLPPIVKRFFAQTVHVAPTHYVFEECIVFVAHCLFTCVIASPMVAPSASPAVTFVLFASLRIDILVAFAVVAVAIAICVQLRAEGVHLFL